MAKIAGKDGKAVLSANKSILDITYLSGVVTIVITGHGYTAGQRILIESVTGMTDINGEFTIATAPTADTITINLTTAQSYTSGGTTKKVITITGWTLDLADGEINITDSSSTTWADYMTKGRVTGSGAIEGFVETADNKPALGTAITLILRINTTHYYSGTAYLISDGVVVEVPGAEAVKVTYNYRFTSTITYTKP